MALLLIADASAEKLGVRRSIAWILVCSMFALGLSACNSSSGTGGSGAETGGKVVSLASIAVTPANPAIAEGGNQQFTAMGTYSDASTLDITGSVTWSSSDTGKAAVSSTGWTTGIAAGTVTITAASGSISGSATLTVTPTLVSISVTPAAASVKIGATQQFTATGAYSDGTTKEVTGSVIWKSSQESLAAVSNGGLATGVADGTAEITAASGGISGTATLTITRSLVSIVVTPANRSMVLGVTQQYTATGTYDDGTAVNISASAAWSSSDTSVAAISITGLATSVAVGAATITATSENISGTTTLTVTPALVSIAVTPASPVIIIGGGTQQFTATGTYSNSTTTVITGLVTWSSSSTGVAPVSNTGWATALAAGTTTITAKSGAISGSTVLTVNPKLLSIAVTPASPVIEAGATQQFTATGTYSSGPAQDLTNSVVWSSSDTNVATISSAGTATGVAAGTPVIYASTSGITGQTVLTVITLTSIDVTPALPSLQINKTQQFTAIGTYSDSSIKDLTSSVTWTSSNDAIATIDAAGLATASSTNTGKIDITALSGGITKSMALTVWKLAVGSPFGFHPAMVSKAGYTPNAGPLNSSHDASYLGVTWTRETLYAYWNVVEPALDGVYDFAQFDAQWSKVPAGMNILANISPCAPTAPAGYCQTNSYLPADETKYTDFVTAVISRYTASYATAGLSSPIKYWQVGNEPISNGTNSFAGLQRITYTAIKAVCSDCTVLIGGVPGMPPVADYLAQFDSGYKPILDALAGQYVDVMDFHWYGNATGDYLGAKDAYDHIRAVLDADSFSATPIWITEMGAYSGDPTTTGYGLQTEQQQALDLFKRYVYSLFLGVERVFPAYGLMEGYWDDGGYFDYTGLIYDGSDPNGSALTDLGIGVKKLGYFTYKKMTEMLEGSDWNITTIPASNNVYIFKIMKGVTPIYVAWWDYFSDGMAVTATKDIAITGLSGTTVTVTEAVPNSATGQFVTYNASAFNTATGVLISGGTATVTINGNPVFVTMP